MSAIVNVTGLQVRYGVIEAVKGIDLTLEQGEITALLGRKRRWQINHPAGAVGINQAGGGIDSIR